MKILTLIVRSLLGLAFVVFGLNILHPFLPMPKEQPPQLAANFAGAMAQSHYMFVVGALQLVGGALLLIGKFVPLGLTLLGPVVVNILLFHIFLEPKGLPIALITSALTLFLLWSYRKAFTGLVKP